MKFDSYIFEKEVNSEYMKKILGVIIPLILATSIVTGMVGCQSTVTVTDTKTTTATQTKTTATTTTATQTVTATVTETPTTTAPVTTEEPATRTIVDMFGRTVTIPTHIEKVLSTGPQGMELIYMIAPDKLAGLSFTFNGDTPLVPEAYVSLPVVGGWFGTQTGNYETFLAIEPDIIIDCGSTDIEERQTKFGDVPVVGVDIGDYMFNYKAAIKFMGEVLGVEEKAAELIDYYTDAVMYASSIVSQIPAAEHLRVYYAEGKDGLSTDPLGSQHTALMAFCGGENVADVALQAGYGMASVSMEELMLWDPDVIIIGRGSQATLYTTIMTDARWSELRAVQEGKVYLRPDNPFSWFDGPPGPCQILGIYWTVNTLYPEQTAELDLNAKIKEFYSNFLHYDITDAEIADLLAVPS